MSEHWEKIIENEIEFYRNFQDYKQDLMDYLEEHVFIQHPTTIFDEDLGQIYLSCPGTEAQAIRRIEIRERIEASLNRGAKRINRLLTSIQQLDEQEREVAIILLENDLSLPAMATKLEYSIKEFLKAKEKVLKKLYAIYKKERDEFIKGIERERKDKFLRNVTLYKQQIGGM